VHGAMYKYLYLLMGRYVAVNLLVGHEPSGN
jgi:hypothetical protein